VIKELIKSLDSEEDTVELGIILARSLNGHGRIYLRGDLGAGKTTLCRGIIRAMGHVGAVKSPTFTLVEPYTFSGGQVYHFDLYRLNDPDELEYIGVDDYFNSGALCLVEWPEKAEGSLPPVDLDIELLIEGRKRTAILGAVSEYGSKVLELIELEIDKDHRE
jgi:tRNA threonylcarbamoyladenosine biosynthesis protein TsaE